MIEFNENPEMHEPEGWNRSSYGVEQTHSFTVYRRRPSLWREDEYVG